MRIAAAVIHRQRNASERQRNVSERLCAATISGTTAEMTGLWTGATTDTATTTGKMIGMKTVVRTGMTDVLSMIGASHSGMTGVTVIGKTLEDKVDDATITVPMVHAMPMLRIDVETLLQSKGVREKVKSRKLYEPITRLITKLPRMLCARPKHKRVGPGRR